MSGLNYKLRWLIAIRMLIAFSITVPFLLYKLGSVETRDAVPQGNPFQTVLEGPASRVLIGLLAIVSVATLVYVALLHFLRHRPQLHAYIQFVGDLLAMTFVIHQLGEAGPGFSIFYLLIISVASVLLRRSAALMIATLAYLCFATATLLPRIEWPPEEGWLSFSAAPLEHSSALLGEELLVYNLGIHLLGFYAVAFLTSYLARDVTRAEERLHARNLDFAYLTVVHSDVIQSISSGLVTTDLNGIMTSVNQSAEKIFGRGGDELLGVHVTESGLFDLPRWEALCAGLGEKTGLGEFVTRTEIEHFRDGVPVHIGSTLTHLRDAENTRRGYILVLEDLTERRQLQEQLRVKDRLAAIGEMAAQLAHEVGNPLAAISGSVQLLARSAKDNSAPHKLLEIILKESRRLDRTVKSFLQLASSRERRLAQIDVAALIAEGVELLKNSEDVGEDHHIVVDSIPDSAMIRADPDQLGQVFWNLARNALQAMPRGGELRITGRLEGESYHLIFGDTGSGMSQEERARLFQPFKSFFDQGTGIGMAIVYRIVEEHGGTISAASQVGEGTRIHVELPVAGPPKGDSAVKSPAVKSPAVQRLEPKIVDPAGLEAAGSEKMGGTA